MLSKLPPRERQIVDILYERGALPVVDISDALPDQISGSALRTMLKRLEDKGMRFSGMSPDGLLPEIIEYPAHPWFIGVQYHPELKSRPFEPHPLFASFVGAAVEQSRLV